MDNNYLAEALDKLGKDAVGKVSDRKEKAMAKPVAEALKNFCKQNAGFARAVAQGGSFTECMAVVAKGVGNCISDLDAYKKAVAFYFPSAKIQMNMVIDLDGDAAKATEPEKPALRLLPKEPTGPVSLVLNLEDFF